MLPSIATALLAVSLPLTLHAQRVTQERTKADSAAQDSTRKARALNPVVTTATRDQRELRKLPVSMTVIDTNTINRTSTVSLTEALRTVPGVIAGNLFGGDDVRLSIRGSGARGGFGVRGVGLLLDGVPITEPDGQTRLDQLDLGAARSIEIVRGPGSAMYGGAASGGVVNVITRSGRELQGVSLRVTGGGFGFDSVNLRKVDLSMGGAEAPSMGTCRRATPRSPACACRTRTTCSGPICASTGRASRMARLHRLPRRRGSVSMPRTAISICRSPVRSPMRVGEVSPGLPIRST